MTFLAAYDIEFGPYLDCPPRLRRDSMRAVLAWVERNRKPPYTIIETGCVRDPTSWSDGMSTRIFDAFVHLHGGQVISIDNNESNCRVARSVTNGCTRVVHADSITGLQRLVAESPELRPDLVYLDSVDVDWNQPHVSALHHLQELCAAMPLINGCLVMIDDNKLDGKAGKSGYIQDFMAMLGANPFIDGYQAAWVMPSRGTHRSVPIESSSMVTNGPEHNEFVRLLLRNGYSPGDVLMLTAAVRDLNLAYPDRYQVAVDTACPDLWLENPHVAPLNGETPDFQVDCGHPPMLDRCNRQPGHYVQSMHDLLSRKLGVEIPVTKFAPDVHLSEEEKSAAIPGVSTPYWVIVAGGKHDLTTKWWPTSSYQQVVDHFKGKTQFVQAGSATDHHPALQDVHNLVGKTSLRELARLIYHSEGVVCPVTCAMHLAAAFDKACVVVAGGRESPHWEMYPGHAYLHTVGQLQCCQTAGCWKARVVPIDDGDHDRNANLCRNPLQLGGQPTAQCMAMITPTDVIRAIERYQGYADGTPVALTAQTAPSLLRKAADSVPSYPNRFEGRGVVIPGGGRYFAQAWVCIHMLRRIGCKLPIELWHLGPDEMTDPWRLALMPLGVQCIDALEVRQRHPARILNGWELKPYAILHSRFREVLLLDADNVPIVDPTFLFGTPQYGKYGAIFWPDYGSLAPERSIWRLTGLAYRDEPEFESGQIVVDKQRCWRPLNLTMWMNEHSDFWYGPIHGDKETFHLAWRTLDVDYAMPSTPIESLDGVMCQHDFEGRRIFQHRNMHKFRLDTPNRRIPGFQYETECLDYLRALRKLSPADRQPFDKTSADSVLLSMAKTLCQSRWRYQRVGYDERPMTFSIDGFVEEGSAGCERTWNLIRESQCNEAITLCVTGDNAVTFKADLANDGTWRGRWLEHERMPVVLSPYEHCGDE